MKEYSSMDSYLVICMSSCCSCGCKIYEDELIGELNLWQTNDKRRTNPNKCRAKSSPKNSGLISGNCTLYWRAEMTNTGFYSGTKILSPPGCIIQSCANTETDKLQRLMRFRVKFFPACSSLVSTHTTERSWVFPWSCCASDVSNNVSSRK